MNKIICSSLLAVGLLSSGPASAQTFTPSGDFTWEGQVFVHKPSNVPFPCTLEVVMGPGGSGAVLKSIKFKPGHAACGLINTTSGNTYPLPLTWNSTTRTFTTPYLYVGTPTPGDCAGPISVTLGANPNPVMNINQVIPYVWAPGDCTVISSPALPLISPLPGSVT